MKFSSTKSSTSPSLINAAQSLKYVLRPQFSGKKNERMFSVNEKIIINI